VPSKIKYIKIGSLFANPKLHMIRDAVEEKIRWEPELMLEERDYLFPEMEDCVKIDLISLYNPKITNLTINNHIDTIPSKPFNDLELIELSPISNSRLQSNLDINVEINPLYL